MPERNVHCVTIVDQQMGVVPEIASIVHDLRNPLSAIHGSAEMLINSSLSESQVHRIARNLYSASVRLQELIDEFLSRYRTASYTPEICDLREVLSQAVNRIRPLAESQEVEIALKVPPGLTIAVDSQRIERVFINLFVNSLDALPGGGRISVSVSAQGDSVSVQVRDSGPGVPAEIRERLFEPFVTAGKQGGLGLGLALSRQTVVDHGGQMWVEFSGKGASFVVRLPLVPMSGTGLC